jgi:hypothetical protein
VCRKDWELHSSKTGGYFRCNRWAEDEEPVDDYVIKPPDGTPVPPESSSGSGNTGGGGQLPFVSGRGDPHTFGTSLHAARMARRRAREMGRFIHHYSRWTAHKESSNLERKMGSTFDSRFAWVLQVAQDEFEAGALDFGNVGT